MKAVILTYAPVKDAEKSIIQTTNIFKLALNQHAEELKPDARIITDYVLSAICSKFPQKIISVREKLRNYSERVEYFDGEFKGSTLLAGLDYLISKNYDEILIVGDNKVNHEQFRNLVNTEIDKIKNQAKIFQYSKGNFNLPVKTITEFCNNL